MICYSLDVFYFGQFLMHLEREAPNPAALLGATQSYLKGNGFHGHRYLIRYSDDAGNTGEWIYTPAECQAGSL